MKCPNPVCKSVRTRTLNTFTAEYNAAGITWELKGLNITRRRKKCDACGEIFWSIELPEEDFKHLRRKTGRLEVAHPSVRPGGGS
jgi:hypothetical protein